MKRIALLLACALVFGAAVMPHRTSTHYHLHCAGRP